MIDKYLNYIQIIEEKIDFQPILQVQVLKQFYPNLANLDVKTSLIRNLIDDSYNLELGVYKFDNEKSNIPYVAINNKFYFQGAKSPLINIGTDEFKSGFKYKFHRSFLNNLSLNNTFVAVFGIDLNDSAQQNHSLLSHYILSPKFKYKKNYSTTSLDQITLLKSIKKVELSLPLEAQQILKSSGKLTKFIPDMKIYYNHIYLVPEPLSQTEATETLFKIYVKNEDASSFIYDHNFSVGNLNSSFLKQKLKTYFEPYNKTQVITKDFGYGSAQLVGQVMINGSTTYDYKLKKVFEDYGPHFKSGIITPYNYKGSFSKEVTMDFNAIFKNFRLRLFGIINEPFLDEDEGQVILRVQNSPNHLEPTWELSFENIK